ncbi:unnamed protein product, partial [Choristocarpus tenellus]
ERKDSVEDEPDESADDANGTGVSGKDKNERTCTSCRKSKVKCDRRAPCTRCVRLKMECIAQTRGRGRPLSAVRAGRRPYPADK